MACNQSKKLSKTNPETFSVSSYFKEHYPNLDPVFIDEMFGIVGEDYDDDDPIH